MEIFEGSHGGRAGLDGMDAVDTLYANTRNNPIEDIESHLPLRLPGMSCARAPVGPENGVAASVRCASSSIRAMAAHRSKVRGTSSPWGFAGGKPGSPAELRLVRRDGSVEVLPSKVPHVQIRAGERFVCVGPAGGGYGNPLARNPERVRRDVADGLRSVEAAHRDYAVVLTSPGSVDEAETAHLRAVRS
jgi:N-methylhydantoinase B